MFLIVPNVLLPGVIEINVSLIITRFKILIIILKFSCN